MPIGTVGNSFTEEPTESKTVANVDTDSNGQFTIAFNTLRRVRSVADVDAHAAGGYVVNAVSVSGNSVTFELHEGIGGTSAGELPLNTDGTDVTDVNARAVER